MGGDTENFAPARSFDPAAWVAEYEALGGHVTVIHRPGKDGETESWFGLFYPRDPEGRGHEMERELYAADRAKAALVADYIEARPALLIPAKVGA